MATNNELLARITESESRNNGEHRNMGSKIADAERRLGKHDIHLAVHDRDIAIIAKESLACKNDRVKVWTTLRQVERDHYLRRGWTRGAGAVIGVIVTVATVAGGLILKLLD